MPPIIVIRNLGLYLRIKLDKCSEWSNVLIKASFSVVVGRAQDSLSVFDVNKLFSAII